MPRTCMSLLLPLHPHVVAALVARHQFVCLDACHCVGWPRRCAVPSKHWPASTPSGQPLPLVCPPPLAKLLPPRAGLFPTGRACHPPGGRSYGARAGSQLQRPFQEPAARVLSNRRRAPERPPHFHHTCCLVAPAHQASHRVTLVALALAYQCPAAVPGLPQPLLSLLIGVLNGLLYSMPPTGPVLHSVAGG